MVLLQHHDVPSLVREGVPHPRAAGSPAASFALRGSLKLHIACRILFYRLFAAGDASMFRSSHLGISDGRMGLPQL